ICETFELDEPFREPVGIDRRPAQPHDLRMRRLANRVVVAPELLVDLLARPRADERDADVPRAGGRIVGEARLLAREADHVLREVDDPHRLPPFQHATPHTAAARPRPPHPHPNPRPRPPIPPACTTSETASGIVMK